MKIESLEMEITGKFRKSTPIAMAILLNVVDKNLVFFTSPRTFLQTHLLTAWSSHHFDRSLTKELIENPPLGFC